MYELPHKLPQNVGLGIFGNKKISWKSQIEQTLPTAKSLFQKQKFKNCVQLTLTTLKWRHYSSNFLKAVIWMN